MKCKNCEKHDCGWLIKEYCSVFIFEDGTVSFNFQGRNRKSYKLRFCCNYPDCKAEINIYLTSNVAKYGKIIKPVWGKKK
jgi:hypothetical protein